MNSFVFDVKRRQKPSDGAETVGDDAEITDRYNLSLKRKVIKASVVHAQHIYSKGRGGVKAKIGYIERLMACLINLSQLALSLVLEPL